MSPLQTETACAATWVALMVDHHCEQPHGHSGPHECACGAMSVDQVTVARMAAALQMIVDHHQPEEYRGGLTCIACHLTQPTEREDRKWISKTSERWNWHSQALCSTCGNSPIRLRN